eukprot:CAMPEP_0114561416 /NCGR_PEP_ID=MMETSP0114-20121206/11992_1 /TAXON_ID=31324 /ORGANISM="Goniomonas sp, Strain m" /LENGTH=219 /DNA_ID=CAMNT_0001747049 /DNA_START=42 /DNA_END=701 /DNA_ORIENTATION=-
MYLYRKAMPRGNKRLDEKWQRHLQELHRERLKTVKAAIDNKAPAKYAHLEQNLKKQQLDEERYSTIERENYLLLDKMSHIMTHPQTVDLRQPAPPVRSLNKEARKRELMRITEENQQILRRIQHKEPYYNHHQWEEDRIKAEQYLKNICEYPVLPSSLRASSFQDAMGGEQSYMGEEYDDMPPVQEEREQRSLPPTQADTVEEEPKKVAEESYGDDFEN